MEVPTILCFLQQEVDIPVSAGCGSGGGQQGFLPGQSFSSTAEQNVDIQFRAVVLLEVYKVSTQDRVQQRSPSRTLTFQLLVMVLLEVFLVLSCAKARCSALWIIVFGGVSVQRRSVDLNVDGSAK